MNNAEFPQPDFTKLQQAFLAFGVTMQEAADALVKLIEFAEISFEELAQLRICQQFVFWGMPERVAEFVAYDLLPRPLVMRMAEVVLSDEGI